MTTEDTKITEDEAQRQEDCEHDWYSQQRRALTVPSAKVVRLMSSDNRALTADDVDELVGALDAALNGLHPVYSNTAGPRGGIGGQAMTPYCQRNYPSSVAWDEFLARAEDVLRKHCLRLESEGRSILDVRWEEPKR